jgi:LEA14-like dessication related protein
MKWNIEVIVIIILFLVNGLIGGIFLITMNSISVPEIISEIDVIDINKNNILLNISIIIDNDNDFSVSIDQFNVISTLSSGDSIGEITLPGGTVSARSQKTFESQASYSLKDYDLKPIGTTIKGTIIIGFFGFFEKEIPITIRNIASIDAIVEEINPPEIQITAGLSEITGKGIGFTGTIDITNPNDFDIIMENMSTVIESDEGEILGAVVIPTTYITQHASTNIPLEGSIDYTALNANTIIIDFKGDVGIHIIGYNSTMPISTRAEIRVPDINEILLINDIFEFSISAEFKVRLQGVVTTVGLKIYNPTNIPFEVDNLECRLYTQTNNQTSLIVQGDMNPCEISTNTEVCIQTEVTMPYLKLLSAPGPGLIPEWFALGITGDFSIQNTTQAIPISINGFVDPNIFT